MPVSNSDAGRQTIYDGSRGEGLLVGAALGAGAAYGVPKGLAMADKHLADRVAKRVDAQQADLITRTMTGNMDMGRAEARAARFKGAADSALKSSHAYKAVQKGTHYANRATNFLKKSPLGVIGTAAAIGGVTGAILDNPRR